MGMWAKTKPDDDIAGPEYCKKCGSTDEPNVYYCLEGCKFGWKRVTGGQVVPTVLPDVRRSDSEKEHLHVTCKACGYQTIRDCYDAETK